MKRKKTFLILMIFLALSVWVVLGMTIRACSSDAHAEEITTPTVTPGQNSTAQANVDFQYMVENKSVSTETPSLLGAYKVDGSTVVALPAWRNLLSGDSMLSTLLRDYQWRIFAGDRWNKKGVKISVLENLRLYSWYDLWFLRDYVVKTTGETPTVIDEEKIYPLDYMPASDSDVEMVSIAQIFAKDADDITMSYVSEIMFQAWKAGGHCRYVTALYDPIPIHRGEVRAFGGVGTYGEAFGPNDIPGKRAATGAGGSGFGSSQSFHYNGGPILVIGWTDKGQPPQPPVAQKLSEEIPGPIGKIITKKPEFVEAPQLRFDLDSDRIYKPEQLAVIEAQARIMAEKIYTLDERQRLGIVGGCSNEGTEAYNSDLGNRRAKAANAAIARIMIHKYGVPETLVRKKIMFASISEFFPDYQGGPKDRRTFLTVIDLL